MDLSMDDVVFQEAVRRRLLGSRSLRGSGQRVVGVGEVEGYLSEGWEFVASLSGRRVVVRSPDFSSRKVDFKQLY